MVISGHQWQIDIIGSLGSLPYGKSAVISPRLAITMLFVPCTSIVIPFSNVFISVTNGAINSSKQPPNGTKPNTKWFLSLKLLAEI
uniref:Uncharacterized protein n=1 Tax=Rhizophagus irregularis (strain DAOM 181602 / DAOM 197198 / MUCL 43194) TaxID=747089 RepID=U9ULW7_RHIID